MFIQIEMGMFIRETGMEIGVKKINEMLQQDLLNDQVRSRRNDQVQSQVRNRRNDQVLNRLLAQHKNQVTSYSAITTAVAGEIRIIIIIGTVALLLQ